MPNSAEVVANELVESWMPELMPIRPALLKKELSDALTTFATQQVKTTWKEASKFVSMFVNDNQQKALSYGKGKRYQWQRDQYHALADLAKEISNEFHRRAQERTDES